MQNSYYNNSSYSQIPTEESLIIPECINWNINSVGNMSTNYRERLMTENTDNNTSVDDSNVPRLQIYTQKIRQKTLKLDINNINTNYDSDDSDVDSAVVNVPKTIKIMDILYNTNFSSQLRSEQNISTISHYLKNIINKTDGRRKSEVYSIKKIVNVLNWIMQDWQIESIAKVIVSITANWTLDESKKGDSRLARLIRKITDEWDPQYIAHLVSILFSTHPLCKEDTESYKEYKEVFLKVLSKRWKFCRLSQFFICLGNKGAINHKLKMHLLQRAAKFEDTKKKMNFNFNNIQKQRPQYIISSPQIPIQTQIQFQQSIPSQIQSYYQTQPQTQTQIHSQIPYQLGQVQSIDNNVKQSNQSQTQDQIQNGQSPQVYQTVMILSPQATIVRNQGSPNSTPGQSPHTTFFQIQDFQRPFFSQSPLNDNASMASSSNSSISVSPSSIPIITSPISTNMPMATIRSMNQAMATMNTQQVSMIMTPSNNPTIINSEDKRTSQDTPNTINSPPMVVSNIITMPFSPQTITNETVVHLSQGTPVIQSLNQQGSSIHSSNTISISSPKIDNSILFSPSTSSTTSHKNSSDISSPSSSHSKLKGKEEENSMYSTSSSTSYSSVIDQPKKQSLLFMTHSSVFPNTTSSPNFQEQLHTSSSPHINVSEPIPLTINVKNIEQKIEDLTLKVEKNNILKSKEESSSTSLSLNEKSSPSILINKISTIKDTNETFNDKIIFDDSNDTMASPKLFSINKKIEQQETSSSLNSKKNIIKATLKNQPSDEIQKEEADTLNMVSLTELKNSKIKNDHPYYEEIFNLDDFNNEEKKAILDIIDSSEEDLDEIQMKKDEEIRNFIQENKKEFTSLSTTPKTPPPSLSSSPFFQK